MASKAKVQGFKCVRCEAELRLSQTRYVCPKCGGNVQVVYDYGALKKKFTRKALERNPERSIWRYLDLLPLKGLRSIPPQQIGWTPLYRSSGLGKSLGLSQLYIKDDGRNPSASFKDRAGAVAVAHALEHGEKLITGASTGNAASSLSCVAAPLGVKTVIFVPESAPVAKIAQLLVFGANVIAVRGTYDEAFDLCLKATAEYGWYNRNTGFNPFTREGKKTCSFEIVEQLGWKIPDKVVVPVGDGNIISGIWKGFTDLHALGLIDKLPALVAVQGGTSDSVLRAFESGQALPAVEGATIADSISVSIPRDGEAAVQALRASRGFAVNVSDAEILSAIPMLARAEGVFAEPAAAASVAGLMKAVAQGIVRPRDRVVLLVTGNGLKDVSSAMKAVGKPFSISPTIDELRQLLPQLPLS